MKTAVNDTPTLALGKHNKFLNTPSFQVVNDVGSSVRWISGHMVSLEFGEHASFIQTVKDWDERTAQSIDFQRRFDALNDDVELAVALDWEMESFKDDFLLPLLSRIDQGNVEQSDAVEAV